MIVVYTLPAIALWAVLGGCLGWCLGALPLTRHAVLLAVLLIATLYATGYGLIEATGKRGLTAPGTTWQVPQTMVMNVPRWRRLLVWGSILGPGFLTRNPYAGFGLLPIVVAAGAGGVRDGVILAAAVGLAHGTGRALALLRDARPGAGADPMRLVLVSMYWRTFDGFALLVIAGATIAACLHQFA